METERHCLFCGEVLKRRTDGGKKESNRDFQRRKFCSKVHSSKYHHMGAVEVKKAVAILEKEEDTARESPAKKTAREILEDMINDPMVDNVTKVNAAKALLPYQEKKVDSAVGKKDELANKSKKAASGKFSAGCAPKVVNIKG